MSIVRTTNYTVDLTYGTTETRWNSFLTCGDKGADELKITLTRGGVAATTGVLSVVLYGVRSDGTTTFVTGTVAGNIVTVALDHTFYAVPGPLELLVQLTEDADVISTPLRVTAYVKGGPTDELVSAGESLGSLAELLGQIAACEAATEDANDAADAIDGMTVAASAVAAGGSPTVAVSDVDGHKHIAFGIPTGLTGATGATGPTGPQGATGADGLTVSVCGVEHVDGDINLTASDIPTSTAGVSVQDAIDGLGGLSFAVDPVDGGLNITYTY